MPNAPMTLIGTQTAGSSVASLVFSNIPNVAKDLVFFASLKSAQGNDDLRIGVGTGTSYIGNQSQNNLRTGATTGEGFSSTLYSNNFRAVTGDTGVSTFSNVTGYITNAFSNVRPTTIFLQSGSVLNSQSLTGGFITTSSTTIPSSLIPISTITFTMAANFTAGSMISLYSVDNGSGGGTIS